MKTNSHFNETVIANSLVAIFERLVDIERAVHALSIQAKPATAIDPSLLSKLELLTLKRHAVLAATLIGASYQEMAQRLGCDETTIKLHLKSALTTLGIRNRTVLRLSHADLLEAIPDTEYKKRFSISKRWWLEDDAALLAVLRDKKAAHNQHVKPS